MPRMKKVSIALVAVLATVALLATAVPSPAASGVKTKVTIKFTAGGTTYTPADSFSGKVKSKNKKCKKKRTVVVKQSGAGKVGKVKSNKKGKWVLDDGDIPPGQYFAK